MSEEKIEKLPAQYRADLLSGQESMFFNVALFEQAQRVAKIFAESTMVPDHFRGNIGNCMIALNFAARIKADPFMVLQSLYVIHGKPGIEGKLVIGLLNSSGRFDPLQFEETGNLTAPVKDNDGCLAFAREIRSGQILKGPRVDWAMVKAEGWLGKQGSKWKTIAPLMFCYRAATYFARVYCPEVLLGMQTREELQEIVSLSPREDGVYDTAPTPAPEKPKTKGMYTGHADGFPPPLPPEPPAKEPPPEKPPEAPTTTRTETKPPEPPPIDVPAWDPRKEAVMGRYHEDKRQAVAAACKEEGIDIAGLKPGEAHQTLLDHLAHQRSKGDDGVEAGPEPGEVDAEVTPDTQDPSPEEQRKLMVQELRDGFSPAVLDRACQSAGFSFGGLDDASKNQIQAAYSKAMQIMAQQSDDQF